MSSLEGEEEEGGGEGREGGGVSDFLSRMREGREYCR